MGLVEIGAVDMAKVHSGENTRSFKEVVRPDAAAPRAPTVAHRGAPSKPEEVDLGPLTKLLGRWEGKGTGWNMIALPFKDSPAPPPPMPGGFNFRVLMNQYDEELVFDFVDENVPNRGLLRPPETEFDQLVSTLDYQQKIAQVAVEDKPPSNDAGGVNAPIHHEPGLWLYMRNLRSGDIQGEINIARLASIPHGNSVLALGFSEEHEGMPEIPPVSGLPIGRFEDLSNGGHDVNSPDATASGTTDPAQPDPYLDPFRHYIDNPFTGNVTTAGFPGFTPADMNNLLRVANQGVQIERTTVLTIDTTRHNGGVSNAPFAAREAEPVSMKSTFWIQELKKQGPKGEPRMRLQYSQVVMLDFFNPREDELPGRAQWPHISIATLEKTPGGYDMKPG
ncbi:heme-binding protein [Salsipaludibacter albus]|uniref:heme-binding protein n=1 Tax=Salsipaludibacter albus TaxID=2849650 RepID=UPI001EE3BF3E|nr:heme-binding protein [Salsipaludibacter albus]MBY5163575.1 hypothetical protein [Salsipaludibacter albus]